MFDTIPLNRFIVCSQGTPVASNDVAGVNTCLKRNRKRARENGTAARVSLLRSSLLVLHMYIYKRNVIMSS